MNYLIVDIKESLEEIEGLHQLKILFDRFPLKDIITILLSIEQEKDYNDILFFEMERRLGDLIDIIDLDMIQIFIENLINIVDNCIYSKLPLCIDPSNYILDNWINNNVIKLKKVK